MKAVRELRIEPDHPCLAGHFPGRPLVPAVVILQRAMAELTQAFPDCRARGISQAKFLSPLAPGENAQLLLERSGPDTARFACTVGERPIATGRFDVEVAGESR